ncbi:MAG: sigma-70 family RNA polymerase sigma factor [Acidobacteria bacterium]|nr:sigma-70 family RNA polymerase sigma factor [Acidobacteriota bacterium]
MEKQPVTALLLDWRKGNKDAGRELFTQLQPELRRIAGMYMSREAAGRTLQATALVNELFVQLMRGAPVAWQDRAHFLAVASQQLRRLLVAAARERLAAKRGGGADRVELNEAHAQSKPLEDEILDLHQALQELEALDPRAAQVIELRYFGGLTEEEAAEAIGISVATLKRDWQAGRAFLVGRLRNPETD